MGLFKNPKNRTADPDSFWGGLLLFGMNRVHAQTLNWGLGHLADPVPEEIAELGCGSGQNIAVLLAKYPKARVTAVDRSVFLVEKATGRNREAIIEGRCIVERGDVSDLKLEENRYDLAVAFEAVYTWPDLTGCFKQAARVLRPGGRILIVNETDGSDAVKIRYEKNNEDMTCYTKEEIHSALAAAGFSQVKAVHHPARQWIAVTAYK